MDWLQIIANTAQILGVIWVLLFGGKAAIQVIGDILRRRPIRQPRASTVTNVLLALILRSFHYASSQQGTHQFFFPQHLLRRQRLLERLL